MKTPSGIIISNYSVSFQVFLCADHAMKKKSSSLGGLVRKKIKAYSSLLLIILKVLSVLYIKKPYTLTLCNPREILCKVTELFIR